ncbi:LysR family transcriptional regulator [Specibacter cremeus]|uniref:LysR family transcriptional regulator n=1 Tax=Specibacter cremeus TaxID=1629051 RepID=UPI000F77CEDC|nr:LysR family transcriptional regulator [Specibacter cremeus]
MVRYTLRQVQHFVAVADAGSIRAASEAAHVSQAGLSLALTELEKALDAQLMVRHKAKGVTLTSAGQRFLGEARALLRHADEVASTVGGDQEELGGPLAVGCYSTLAAFWIPPITAGFLARHPKLRLQLTEGSPGELQAMALDGRLDAVLTHTRHVAAGMDFRVIASGVPYVLVGAGHRLAGRPGVRLAELADDDMVLLDIPSVRDNQLPNLRASGLEPRIAWRSTSFEAVRGMVARGLGYTVLVQRPAHDVSYEGLPLVALPIEGPIGHSDICVAFPAGTRLSPRLAALIDFCEAYDPAAPTM